LLERSRRFGSVPGEIVIEHVLRTASGGDFAVYEAAADALRRRWEFALRDGLRVTSRPKGRGVLGAYTTARAPDSKGERRKEPAGKRSNGKAQRTRRARREPRPYTSVLESVQPLRASCDCPDFLRSSLGVCKHLLIVLDDVFSSRRRAAAAQTETFEPVSRGPRLSWDFALPLTGALDRLAGLRLEGGANWRSTKRHAGVLGTIERGFSNGSPDRRLLENPAHRRELLSALTRALEPGPGDRSPLDASSAARALVLEESERALRLSKYDAEAPRTLLHLRSLERKLYPYQLEGVERFLRNGRLLLADDMGLGKTTQAIAACHALFRAGRVRRGLVIVPASLKPQWHREWQETTQVGAAVVEGTPEERARRYRDLDGGFLIIGYEQLLRDFEHVQRLDPEIVVLDEAQRIKNYASKSAAYVKALAPEYRLVLTGTPMENRLEELASILDFVDDLALAPKWRLVPWYTAWQGDGGPTGRAGARHLDTLRRRIGGVVVRRVRRDVLAQLPSRTDTRVPVEMTPQQMEEHDLMNQDIMKLLAIAKRRPLRQAEFLKLMKLLTRQRIVSNGLGQLRFEDIWPVYSRARPDAALLEGLFAPKLSELRRLVGDLVVEQERKVVVFSQWRRMLRLAEWSVRDLLAGAGVRAAFFTGAERPLQRTRSIVDFHDDPRVRIMFLSDAGGVGLNLQRAASACINLELPWNPAVLEQRIGRIYRLGQKHPIDVYNLVSETGIESRIASLVGAKQALFSGLFDGTSDEIRFDAAASFLKRVESIVEAGPLPEPPRADAGSAVEATEQPESEDADIALPSNATALDESALADELPAALEPRSSALWNGNAVTREASSMEGPAVISTAALFRALRVERTSEGGVRIEAPPEAAESLVALFEGMAKLLSMSTQQ
jgi:superfamily II DNA or RNA helicase